MLPAMGSTITMRYNVNKLTCNDFNMEMQCNVENVKALFIVLLFCSLIVFKSYVVRTRFVGRVLNSSSVCFTQKKVLNCIYIDCPKYITYSY